MSDEPLSHTQHFQQAIDTTITCRSIIKYNSTLSEQQKAEILASIDITLDFLGACQTINVTGDLRVETTSTKQLNSMSIDFIPELADGEALSEEGEQDQDLSLKNLYRIYHNYLNSTHIADLETHYRMVMSVLEQLEEVAKQQHDTTSGDLTAEHMLHRVRGFITSVYCMFREFAAVFSHIVEGKTIDMDTEALAMLDQYSLAEGSKSQQMLRDITPLLHVYAEHLQVQAYKGLLTRCAGDAIAFLVFLEEGLEPTFNRRSDIIAQLKAIAVLLTDLTSLLAGYEQAMSALAAI